MTTGIKNRTSLAGIEGLMMQDRDFLKDLIKESLQEVMEAEMSETLGATPSARTQGRSGYRSGYYSRELVTRIGKLELRVPRDREGRVFNGAFRSLRVFGKGAGCGLGRDVRAGCFDAQGQGDHRGAVRAFVPHRSTRRHRSPEKISGK